MGPGLAISLSNIRRQGNQKKVFLIKKDRLLGISSGGDVINCSFKFYPQWSDHVCQYSISIWAGILERVTFTNFVILQALTPYTLFSDNADCSPLTVKVCAAGSGCMVLYRRYGGSQD